LLADSFRFFPEYRFVTNQAGQFIDSGNLPSDGAQEQSHHHRQRQGAFAQTHLPEQVALGQCERMDQAMKQRFYFIG
jgi:hypothetical protein